MEERTFQILLIIVSCIVIPSAVPTIIAIYKTTHIKTIFKRIDELQEHKADKVALEKIDAKQRETELKIAESFGRFEAGLSRLEKIEKSLEHAIDKINAIKETK